MGERAAGCFKSIINFVHFLVLLVGLAVLGISIYILVQIYSEHTQVDKADYWIAWVPFALSLILIILSILGCCTTTSESKCGLGIYGTLQFLFAIAFIAAGAGLLTLNSASKNAAETTNGNNVGNSGFGFDKIWWDQTVYTYKYCCDPTLSLAQCGSGNTNNSICVWNYDIVTSNSDYYSNSVCASIEQFVVSCPEDNGTAADKLNMYQKQYYDYSKQYYYPSGIALCVFGSILFLCFIGSMYLCCCHNNTETVKNQNQQSGHTYSDGTSLAGTTYVARA